MLEDGELEGFSAACDEKSIKRRVREIAAIKKLVEMLSGDVLTLRGESKKPKTITRSEPAKGRSSPTL